MIHDWPGLSSYRSLLQLNSGFQPNDHWIRQNRFYLVTRKSCACCSRKFFFIPSLISHWVIFGLNPPLLPIPLGIPSTWFILNFLWEFWFSVSWPPPLKLPLTFSFVGIDIFWNLLTLKIIESSARQFSQLPCFSSCINLCSKTGKLKVTHLFLIFLWFTAIPPPHGSSNPFYALCKYIAPVHFLYCFLKFTEEQ